MTAAPATHLWLRAETKKNEHRSALTPGVCKTLIEAGYKITVERCKQRIFDDEEFVKAGATLAATGTWQTAAPASAYIIGLKELPEHDTTSPLAHTHIFFGHCYKQQAGWREVLGRFTRGGGMLLDMEFLADASGRRVAAFGYHAGFAGTAVGLQTWCHQVLNGGTPLGAIKSYPNEDELIAYIKQQLALATAKSGTRPKVMVIGALGRCGTGAVDFALRVGIPESDILKWDMAETKRGGPFTEIVNDADVFVNCIYLSLPIPPFVTRDMLDAPDRRLSVVVDVSCDATNPHNPIPIYDACTTFDVPTLKVVTKNPKPLDVIAIDHLPTLLPREASVNFSEALLPSLLLLKDRQNSPVWQGAEKLFHEKVAAAAAL